MRTRRGSEQQENVRDRKGRWYMHRKPDSIHEATVQVNVTGRVRRSIRERESAPSNAPNSKSDTPLAAVRTTGNCRWRSSRGSWGGLTFGR